MSSKETISLYQVIKTAGAILNSSMLLGVVRKGMQKGHAAVHA